MHPKGVREMDRVAAEKVRLGWQVACRTGPGLDSGGLAEALVHQVIEQRFFRNDLRATAAEFVGETLNAVLALGAPAASVNSRRPA